MESILDERQLTSTQQEEVELKRVAPDKFEQEFDPDFEFKINKNAADAKKKVWRPLTREECAALLAASAAPCEPTPVEPMKHQYPTMTREQAEALMTKHYAYQEKERKRKQNLK